MIRRIKASISSLRGDIIEALKSYCLTNPRELAMYNEVLEEEQQYWAPLISEGMAAAQFVAAYTNHLRESPGVPFRFTLQVSDVETFVNHTSLFDRTELSVVPAAGQSGYYFKVKGPGGDLMQRFGDQLGLPVTHGGPVKVMVHTPIPPEASFSIREIVGEGGIYRHLRRHFNVDLFRIAEQVGRAVGHTALEFSSRTAQIDTDLAQKLLNFNIDASVRSGYWSVDFSYANVSALPGVNKEQVIIGTYSRTKPQLVQTTEGNNKVQLSMSQSINRPMDANTQLRLFLGNKFTSQTQSAEFAHRARALAHVVNYNNNPHPLLEVPPSWG